MLKEMMLCEPPPKEEVVSRIERFKKRMEEEDFSLSIILQNVDLFYFTGTMQKSILVIPADGEPLFFVEKVWRGQRWRPPLKLYQRVRKYM